MEPRITLQKYIPRVKVGILVGENISLDIAEGKFPACFDPVLEGLE